MKKAILWTLAGVVGAMSAGAEIVPPDVAQGMAEEVVAREFADAQWSCLWHEVAVGAEEGAGPAAYVFVFGADGMLDLQGVKERVAAGEGYDDGESELYVNTATVITGANDSDVLVMGMLRGLPDWLAEAWGAPLGASLVRMGDGDFRVVAKSAAPKGLARLLGRKTAEQKRWADLRKEKAVRAARAAEEDEGLSEDLRALEAEGAAAAAAAHRGAWAARAAKAATAPSASSANGGEQ